MARPRDITRVRRRVFAVDQEREMVSIVRVWIVIQFIIVVLGHYIARLMRAVTCSRLVMHHPDGVCRRLDSRDGLWVVKI